MVHINNPDNIVIMDWLVKSMKSVSGTITTFNLSFRLVVCKLWSRYSLVPFGYF